MKKFLLLFTTLTLTTVAMAQQFVGDSLQMAYVPNQGKDNWELNVAGGVSVLFNGLRRPDVKNDLGFYDCVGGAGEITASKWFNPYVAVRFGWLGEYMPYKNSKSESAHNLATWNNYFHFDAMWDWTSQFGGYKADRVYNFVPYVHMGVVYNPQNNAMIGGGVGILNRFRLAEHWMLNIDLRALATSASKYNNNRGMAVEAQALVGVSYRFSNATWKTKVKAANTEKIEMLMLENADLLAANQKLQDENQSLWDQRRAEQVKDAAQDRVVETVNTVSNAKELLKKLEKITVYYRIGADELSTVEKAHITTYLTAIRFADPNSDYAYEVTGRADTRTGTKEYNEALAQRRADSVKQQLVASGVPEDHITTSVELVDTGDCNVDRSAEIRFVEK